MDKFRVGQRVRLKRLAEFSEYAFADGVNLPPRSIGQEPIALRYFDTLDTHKYIYQEDVVNVEFYPHSEFLYTHAQPVAEIQAEALEKARAKRYGEWAGCPNGYAYVEGRCAYEIYNNFNMFLQCTRKNGYGINGLYCKQHSKMVKQPSPAIGTKDES